MASSYYNESQDTPPAPEGGEEQEPKEDSGEQTELVNSSLFGGDCKPGDKYTVEVVAVHDDQLEVKHVKDGKEGEAEPESRSTDGAMDRMSKYADMP